MDRKRVVWMTGLAALFAGCKDADAVGAVPDTSGHDCASNRLLVVTSDWSEARLGLLELESGETEVAGAVAADGDTALAQVGCATVLLERTTGALKIQDTIDPFETYSTLPLDPDTAETSYGANPQSLAVYDASSVYVALQAQNKLGRVDLETEAAPVRRNPIDLAPYLVDEDTSGVVDAVDVTRIGDRVYVGLGNYWFDESFAQHFTGSTLAVFDSATGAAVDMDEDGSGVQGIALQAENLARLCGCCCEKVYVAQAHPMPTEARRSTVASRSSISLRAIARTARVGGGARRRAGHVCWRRTGRFGWSSGIAQAVCRWRGCIRGRCERCGRIHLVPG